METLLQSVQLLSKVSRLCYDTVKFNLITMEVY